MLNNVGVGDRIMEKEVRLKKAGIKIKKVISFGIIPVFKDKEDHKILIV